MRYLINTYNEDGHMVLSVTNYGPKGPQFYSELVQHQQQAGRATYIVDSAMPNEIVACLIFKAGGEYYGYIELVKG